MRINELVQKINDIDGISAELDDVLVYVYQSSWNRKKWFLLVSVTDSPEKIITAWNNFPAVGFSEMAKLFALVDEFLKTPFKNRLQRYRVPLRGLESDNGPQYLTTSDGVNYFACAYNPRLKQFFTKDDFIEILNLPQFKTTPWAPLLSTFMEEATNEP